MKTVLKIIDANGGIDRFPALKIENHPYMPLCIERIGPGPRGYPSISVAHYYQQNGDMMADPDLVFEVLPDGWEPIEYTQHNIGLYQRAAWTDPVNGKVISKPGIVRDLKAFAFTWDRNLDEQGFGTIKPIETEKEKK